MMGKICYDCATEKINGVCPNCYPDEVKSPKMDEKIKKIFITSRENAENKVLEEYSDYINSLHNRIKKLEKGIKKHKWHSCRSTMGISILDEDLYKLVEKEGEYELTNSH